MIWLLVAGVGVAIGALLAGSWRSASRMVDNAPTFDTHTHAAINVTIPFTEADRELLAEIERGEG